MAQVEHLEVEVLEVEVLEVLEAEVLEVLEVEVLEVLEAEVLETIDLDYHLLVVILETILFLKNNTRKNLVISRLRLPMHFCRGVFGTSLQVSGIFRRVAADLKSYDPVHCL
jgi:hypothetical protein